MRSHRGRALVSHCGISGPGWTRTSDLGIMRPILELPKCGRSPYESRTNTGTSHISEAPIRELPTSKLTQELTQLQGRLSQPRPVGRIGRVVPRPKHHPNATNSFPTRHLPLVWPTANPVNGSLSGSVYPPEPAPRPFTVTRELGHGGDSLVKRIYGH